MYENFEYLNLIKYRYGRHSYRPRTIKCIGPRSAAFRYGPARFWIAGKYPYDRIPRVFCARPMLFRIVNRAANERLFDDSAHGTRCRTKG